MTAPAAPARRRILHLGFEDPAMPGSGGGSLRTREINRVIARHHDVTVLTSRYPGCVDRTEDGIRWEHVGVGQGRRYLSRVVGYYAALPLATWRRPSDLLVEDFSAPMSSVLTPLWTRRPRVAMVQWLNAREKAEQYHLPLHWVERAGVRLHRQFVAVSAGIGERLAAANPSARVTVVGNGVAPSAFSARTGGEERGDDVVFVGRLETAQKGLDLLLDAFAAVADRLPGRLVIAGTGHDGPRLRDRAMALGVADRIDWAGWVDGEAKYRLLAGARVVAMPSRFETFGIVAVEALACGTPVVAFDIPCLREVVPDGIGHRVPPFDVDAYGEALVAAAGQGRTATEATAERARAFAARFRWDDLAERQRAVYESVLQAAGR